MVTRETLSNDIFRMARAGGYVFIFSGRVARAIPDMTWEEYRAKLADNGGFCGYADAAIRKAFGR
jgi:hypothetical protein